MPMQQQTNPWQCILVLTAPSLQALSMVPTHTSACAGCQRSQRAYTHIANTVSKSTHALLLSYFSNEGMYPRASQR